MNGMMRKLIRLAIVAIVIGGGYFLGSKYLWPAPDTRTIKDCRNHRGARGEYHQPHRRADRAARPG